MDQIAQTAPEPIELPDNEGVAGGQGLEAAQQGGALRNVSMR